MEVVLLVNRCGELLWIPRMIPRTVGLELLAAGWRVYFAG